jgi:hypothetical protein
VVGGVDEAVPLVAERRSGLLMVFVFQRRERRLEQMRGKGGGCVLVCLGEEENQRGRAAGLCKQGKGGLRPPLLSLVFCSLGRRGAPLLLKKKDGFRVRFFVFFFMLSKLPPLLFELWTSIYK